MNYYFCSAHTMRYFFCLCHAVSCSIKNKDIHHVKKGHYTLIFFNFVSGIIPTGVRTSASNSFGSVIFAIISFLCPRCANRHWSSLAKDFACRDVISSVISVRSTAVLRSDFHRLCANACSRNFVFSVVAGFCFEIAEIVLHVALNCSQEQTNILPGNKNDKTEIFKWRWPPVCPNET